MRKGFQALMAVVVISSSGALMACGTASLKELTPHPTNTALDLTFRNGVIPVFVGKECDRAGCHTLDFGAPAGQLTLGGTGVTPDELYVYVVTSGGSLQRSGGGTVFDADTANPTQSLLYTKPNSDFPGVTHGGGKFFGNADPEAKTILGWIQAGAHNN